MASKEHVELAEFIKSVHRDLRVLSRSVGPNEAWAEHCKNVDVLKVYMSSLCCFFELGFRLFSIPINIVLFLFLVI